MSTLYVQLQGAQVRRRHEQIIVVHQGRVVERVPRRSIERIVVMGRGVQLSTALLVELLADGIPVVLTNQEGSRHYATLQPGLSNAGELRLQQYGRSRDEAWQLGVARQLIVRKVSRQSQLLRQQGWPQTAAAQQTLQAAVTNAAAADSLDSLRGSEGSAAAAYFAVWRRQLPPALGFAGRAYRPPRDPVNALLSFGYTMLLGTITATLQQTGLDPYLGCFHTTQDGRPSLALDLIEPYRPLLVDRLVLRWVAEGVVREELFTPAAGTDAARYLNAEGRRRFIAAFEQQLSGPLRLHSGEQVSAQRLLLLDAQAFARHVRGVTAFAPLRLAGEAADVDGHQL